MSVTHSARLKLERARQHLMDLRRETRAWAAKPPFHFQLVRDGATDPLAVVVRLPDGQVPVPARLGLMAGDAAHNLRSSLDHLVWSLAGDAADRRNEFPILVDERRWRDVVREQLHHVPPSAATRILGLQPFQARPAADADELHERHPLARNMVLLALSRLDNLDKHRAILPRRPVIRFSRPGFSGVARVEGTFLHEWVEVEDGAEIFRVTTLVPSARGGPVALTRAPSFTLVFGNTRWDGDRFWSDPSSVGMTGADLSRAADMVELILAESGEPS